MAFRKGPSAKYIVDECHVVLAIMFGIDDGAAHFLERQFLALHFARTLLVFARFAELFIDGAEDPVDEPSGGFAAEGFRELDSLVDSHFCRHLRAVRKEELVEAEPQDIAVNGSNALQWP